MAEKKDLPRWVQTGDPSDAGKASDAKPEPEEKPQEEVEILPPPASQAEKQENETQRRPWTPPSVSQEEHQKQIEAARTRGVPLSEGNAPPPDRSIVTPADPPVPAPLDPQAEQAMRLREIWGHAQALNPAGMPISAIQMSDTVAEVTMEDGIETTTIRLGQDYVAGPDANGQAHGMASHSSERPTIPCPRCGGSGTVSAGWVHKNNGDAA